jgi:uncharacterized membrane protein YphA (DoxX/SURF4 family)
MSDAAGAFVLLGRILFVIQLLFAGVAFHMQKTKMAEQYAQAMRFPVPAIAGWPIGIWMVAGSVSVALGIWPDLGSLMLGAFLLTAMAYFHRYWELEDEQQKMLQQTQFFRNLSMLGAALVMFGTFVALGPELRFTITEPLFSF